MMENKGMLYVASSTVLGILPDDIIPVCIASVPNGANVMSLHDATGVSLNYMEYRNGEWKIGDKRAFEIVQRLKEQVGYRDIAFIGGDGPGSDLYLKMFVMWLRDSGYIVKPWKPRFDGSSAGAVS